MRIALLAAIGCVTGLAQAPAKPALENTGKPMRVAVECTEDDIQSFGMACTPEEPCPVYLELSAVETVAGRIFLTGNFHTASSTLASVLLASLDSGKSWVEPHPRVRTGGLEGIQFIDLERGWIAGQLLQAMPRDPFFLITSDGGKTWRQRAVFSESRVGTVEQFVFDSRDNGSMLIDRTQTGDTGGRWELYESRTGGESWSLRQVSVKPLKLARMRSLNTDWRIRTDAQAKSWRLEKREGQKWATVASFLVTAGECAPKEIPLVAPPSEEELEAQKQKEAEASGVFVVPSGKKPAPRKKR